MLKVVVIGYGEMFTNLIAGALDANCNIVGVYRREMLDYNPIFRKIKDIINPSCEYNYIKSYNLYEINNSISCLKSRKERGVNSEEFKKELLKLNPDIILVGSWGEKFSKEIYSLPKIASINAHPSLLPKYRGPNPYFWAIRNQETSSGVTFHLIDEGFDTGAILAQEEIKIYPSDTGKSLKERTVLTARGVVCELLKDLSEDIIIPLTQIEEKSSYYSQPSDLELDFDTTAQENAALIRAAYPWSHAYFFHETTCLIVEHDGIEIFENDTPYMGSKTVVDCNPKTKDISILCADNKILKMRVNHLKKYDRPFISNYLKHDIKIGEKI